MTSETNKQPDNNVQQSQEKRPNEVGAFHLEGYVKIYDPESREVYLETRA